MFPVHDSVNSGMSENAVFPTKRNWMVDNWIPGEQNQNTVSYFLMTSVSGVWVDAR
jgi:hypothetical protein